MMIVLIMMIMMIMMISLMRNDPRARVGGKREGEGKGL